MAHYRFGENKTFIDDIPDGIVMANKEQQAPSPITNTKLGIEFQKRGLELKSVLIGVLAGVVISYLLGNSK